MIAGGALMEVIESLGPLVSHVVGQDAQVINIQPRTVPSFVVAVGEPPPTRGYTNWHRDEGNGSGVFVHPLITTNVKLIVAVGEQQSQLCIYMLAIDRPLSALYIHAGD